MRNKIRLFFPTQRCPTLFRFWGLFRALLCLLSFSSLNSCTSWTQRDLLPKEAYLPVSQALLNAAPQSALASFPSGESGGFLTETEKAWLQVLGGDTKGALTRLRPMTEDLAARQTLSISGSLSTFFYKELEDSYYPAEHEVIFVHLVAATAYAKDEQCQQALVELRRAAFYLQGQFEHTRPQFDHGAFRLWNAFLWHYCGEWESARIDLRVAAKLTQNSQLARLAETATPPAYLELILEGIGPEAKQDEKSQTDVIFVSALQRPLAEQITQVEARSSISTLDIYPRLVERNRLLDEVMQSSRYYVDWTGYTLASSAMYSASVVGAGTLIAGGIGLIGAGVVGGIYIAAASHSAELGGIVGASLATGGLWMIGRGIDVGSTGTKTATDMRKQGLDRSAGFRFLRYIPDAFTLSWQAPEKVATTESSIIMLDSTEPLPSQAEVSPKREIKLNRQRKLSLLPSDPITRMAAESVSKGPLIADPEIYLTEQAVSREDAKEFCRILGSMLDKSFVLPHADLLRTGLKSKVWELANSQEFPVWTLDSPCSRFALDTRRLLKSESCPHLALVACLAVHE